MDLVVHLIIVHLILIFHIVIVLEEYLVQTIYLDILIILIVMQQERWSIHLHHILIIIKEVLKVIFIMDQEEQ